MAPHPGGGVTPHTGRGVATNPGRGRSGRALLDALFVAAVSFAATVTDPLHHRAAWALALLAAAGAIGGGLLAPGLGFAIVLGVSGGVLAAVVIWLALLLLAALLVEWPAFVHCAVVFRHHDGQGRAVARVRTPPGRTNTWRVSSVTAWPRGAGRGSALMREVVRAADQRGLGLELSPSTPRVREWYRRLGFADTTGRRLRRDPT